jgi:FtsZ-binding cell division protein ZapB
MATANQPLSIQKAETEIAVLKVQVDNIEERVGEIKQDVKDLQRSIDIKTEETQTMIKDMRQASSDAHKGMNDKITAIEKWRWMMMGAGIALGALGHNFLGNILK